MRGQWVKAYKRKVVGVLLAQTITGDSIPFLPGVALFPELVVLSCPGSKETTWDHAGGCGVHNPQYHRMRRCDEQELVIADVQKTLLNFLLR